MGMVVLMVYRNGGSGLRGRVLLKTVYCGEVFFWLENRRHGPESQLTAVAAQLLNRRSQRDGMIGMRTNLMDDCP